MEVTQSDTKVPFVILNPKCPNEMIYILPYATPLKKAVEVKDFDAVSVISESEKLWGNFSFINGH